MGKVFTPDEIKNGLIPTPADFILAKSLLLKDSKLLIAEGHLISVKTFGSVVSGQSNRRSDLDALIIYRNVDSLIPLSASIRGIFENTHVPIEPILLSQEQAQTGRHLTNPSIIYQIRFVTNEGNLMGMDPLLILKSQIYSPKDFCDSYLDHKIRTFTQGIVTANERDKYHAMQRAMEAPMNVGRVVLNSLFPENDFTHRAQVIESFHNRFDQIGLGSIFELLRETNIVYTQVLSKVLEHKIDLFSYSRFIDQTCSEILPQALTWINGLQKELSSTIEGNPSRKEVR